MPRPVRVNPWFRSFIRLLAVVSALTGVVGPAAGWAGDPSFRLSGRTMGTTYHITVVAASLADIQGLKDRIEDCLEQVNQSMSTYRPDSEISRFNALADTRTTFQMSPSFARVMAVARQVHQLTAGAWDATVNPLVNLWGFGKAGPVQKPPSTTQIDAALQQVGFHRIQFEGDHVLRKKTPGVSLDLASIAKGFGVDQVSRVIRDRGLANFLVEIGGEVYAAGHRGDGRPWRVGINRPRKGAAPTDVVQVVAMTDRSLATSGDYRNYFKAGKTSFSHIIDPRTGHPVANSVVSASVLADRCVLADALATALMVMGPQDGLRLVGRLDGVEALMMVRRGDGHLVYFRTRRWPVQK